VFYLRLQGGQMKREIKFRCWCFEHSLMFIPSFLDFRIGKLVNVLGHGCAGDGFKESGGHEKNSFIVMQFTGLHDKNGKEIYEGDIVRWNDTGTLHTCKIVYDPPHYVGKVIERPGVASVWGWFQYDPDVIGNVHENPELEK